jgi:DNA-binding GntR family transcriptional regulator
MTMSYREIANDIQERIGRGDWPAGRRVPTTAEFAEQYGVSEATAYRALSTLIDRGVLRGESGRGRFVADQGSTDG